MIAKKMLALGKSDSAIRAIAAYGDARRSEIGSENVFDFSIGNPNVPAPEKVKNTLIELLRNEESLSVHGYTAAPGAMAARKAAAAQESKRAGYDIPAESIYITSGASSSLSIVMSALVSEGEKVAVLAPFFPEYHPYVDLTGAVLKVVPPNLENFQINFEAFEEMLTEKVKAVLINTPNNPSGVVYSTPTLQRLADILREKSKEYGHIIYLISDEPYREIVFEGVDSPCVSYFYDNTIMCYSFSKSLSLPGERIGYVAVNPACEDAETMINMCGQISRGIGHNCPPSIIQLAVAQVLDKTADLSVYETNMNILYKELLDLGFTCVKPGGTFYIFPKALEEDAKVFSQKALKYDLVLVPGDSFGAPGYFRMAYCVDTEKVERSLEAFRKFVKTEYGKESL